MTPILIADISVYQGAKGMSFARWDELANRGVRAVGIRATVGHRVDTAFEENVKRAQGHDIIPTAYHFQLPGDPVGQADLFLSTVGNLPGWLDVEQNGLTRHDVAAYGRRVDDKRPKGFSGVYSSATKWRALTDNMDGRELFDACWNALWTERGVRTAADLPPVEPKPRWGGFDDALWWQWGPLRLRHGIVDGDAFYGSLADLKVILGQKPPRPPLQERPRYIAGHNAALDAVLAALPAIPVTIPIPGGVGEAGAAAAKAAVADAVASLKLGVPA